MALLGSDFDPTIPRDTDPVANGAAEIRDFKSRVKDFASVSFNLDTGTLKTAASNITLSSSDPDNPNLGDVYFNTIILKAFVFTSGGWVLIVNANIPASQQYFSASGSFTVPNFIYRLKIHAWGAGGGGANAGAQAVGAGGGGAYGTAIVTVTPAQVIPFTIGTGGAGGASSSTNGANGGDTTILTRTAGGGVGGLFSPPTGGAGGVASGFDLNLSGQYGMSNITGSGATAHGSGGDAGAWGGKGGVLAVNGTNVGRNGVAPGGGGSSSGNGSVSSPGNGADGAIIIEY